MAASATSFSIMLATALLAASVNAHGYMSDPAVKFLTTNDPTQFIATIESSASGFSGTFNAAPSDNTAAFTTAFESSKYPSLKDFINDKATITVTDATLTCGACDPDETAQPLPDTYVEWAHSDSEGFPASHEGPCEIWCDDVRVFQDNDGAADYTAPAKLPYDHDACLGSSVLTFYWLALHSSTWQVYVNCAPLESTTSTGATSKYATSGTSSGTSTSTTTTTSTVSSAAGSSASSNSTSYDFQTNYATSTSASTSSEASTTTTTDAPATTTAPVATTATPTATTATTATTTDAPATSTDTTKCTVRRHRN